MVSRRTMLVVGILLGALFLLLAGRSLDLGTLAQALSRAKITDIVAMVACVFLYLLFKTLRWRYLVHPFTHASTADLLPAVYAGNAGNLIVPHAGEIVRAIVANRRLKVATSALLASVAVERIFDFLTLLLIALAALVPVGRMSPDMLVASYAIGTFAVAMLGAAAALLLRTEACLGLLERALVPVRAGLRAGVMRHLRSGVAGLHSIARPQLFLPVFLFSVLQWLMVAACVALSIDAVDASVSAAAAISVLVLNVIGLTLPAAPGQVGTVQLAFTIALAPFGMAHADAFAAAVVYNSVMVATGIAFGLPSLRSAGVELRRLLRTNEPEERT